MPISVFDLKPGERVMLNCPKARGKPKREAQFDGIFTSIEDAMGKSRCPINALVIGPSTVEFLQGSKAWARFIMQTVSGPASIVEYPGGGAICDLPLGGRLFLACVIEPDGGLREEQGRRIFVERRMTMGQG